MNAFTQQLLSSAALLLAAVLGIGSASSAEPGRPASSAPQGSSAQVSPQSVAPQLHGTLCRPATLDGPCDQPVKEFASGEPIQVHVTVTDAEADTEVRSEVFHGDLLLEHHVATPEIADPEPGARYELTQTHKFERPGGLLPSQAYRIDLRLDGALMQSLPFSVARPPQSSGPILWRRGGLMRGEPDSQALTETRSFTPSDVLVVWGDLRAGTGSWVLVEFFHEGQKQTLSLVSTPFAQNHDDLRLELRLEERDRLKPGSWEAVVYGDGTELDRLPFDVVAESP